LVYCNSTGRKKQDGKGLEKGTASYSFRYWIGAEDHTLSGEEIDAFHAAFLGFLKNQGISLRS